MRDSWHMYEMGVFIEVLTYLGRLNKEGTPSPNILDTLFFKSDNLIPLKNILMLFLISDSLIFPFFLLTLFFISDSLTIFLFLLTIFFIKVTA